MNPARFQTFAEAYAVAVLQAVVELNLHTAGKTAQQYALDAALALLDTIEARGAAAVEHYVINRLGGAFRHTCEALGLPATTRALQDYLEE